MVDGGVRGDDVGDVCGAAVSDCNGWRGGAITVAGKCAFMSPTALAGSQYMSTASLQENASVACYVFSNDAQSQGVVHSVEQSISQVKQGPVWLAR